MTNENISVTEVQNENSVIAERRAKLLKLREHGVAYPNDFVRKDLFGDLNEKYGNKTAEELAALAPKVACAGRVMLKRVMGRLTFATVRDYTGTMQYFVQESTVGEAAYADFKTLDLGDIVACEGTLMRTQAGDLAIKVTSFRLMAKSLRPMPDKHKGLQDQEFCYRRRYVDGQCRITRALYQAFEGNCLHSQFHAGQQLPGSGNADAASDSGRRQCTSLHHAP